MIRLKNKLGYEILRKRISNTDYKTNRGIILAFTIYHEFATWEINLSTDDTYNGHYYPNTPEGLQSALNDFNKRV